MKSYFNTCFAACLCLALPALANPTANSAVNSAAREEMVTDRPDRTESAALIAPGRLQIESGWLYVDDGKAGRSLTPFATLFRVGVLPRLEARLELGGLTKDWAADETGLGDAGLGLKLRLWEEQGARPAAALILGSSLPIGEPGNSSERFDPGFRFAFSHTLKDRIGIGYNLGMAWETVESPTRRLLDVMRGSVGVERTTGALGIYTATVGVGLTRRLGMFIEVFGDIPLNAADGPAHRLDAGFTWAATPQLQFDLSGGFGLNGHAEGWFVGGGISVRLPE